MMRLLELLDYYKVNCRRSEYLKIRHCVIYQADLEFVKKSTQARFLGKKNYPKVRKLLLMPNCNKTAANKYWLLNSG